VAVSEPASRPDPDGGDQPGLVDPGLMPAGADAHLPTGEAADEAGETATLYPPDGRDRPGWHVRLFGSPAFFRLWLAQVVASLGDWCGFFAIAFLAGEVSTGSQAGAIGLVMTARILPGFFLAPLGGVLVDRFDRRRIMIVCNLGRAVVVALLPFVDSVALLVLASFVLEAFALVYAPAKEASVPNLVPHDHLTTANSLGMAAAYGTFPVASAVFALLATVSTWISDVGLFDVFRTDQVAVAFYFQAVAFCASAWMIRSLDIPHRSRRERTGPVRIDWAGTLRELKEGWQYIFINHNVRAVNLGLATGLVGGGMLIPLGAAFSSEVLDAGASGYGIFITSLGFGVATGVVAVSALQKRLPRTRVFSGALLSAGVALALAASTSDLWVAAAFVFVMGVSAGPIYVLGFAILQSEVDDALRGRVISALNTLVRLCVLVSMVIGPLLADVTGRISQRLIQGEIEVAGAALALPGVRLTLWLAALIIFGAGIVTTRTLRAGARLAAAGDGSHPARPPGVEAR
jgi:dTMP kinase